MKVVGLTGGVGSGKSLVAQMFLELGARVIDADELAREVVVPGSPAWKEIVERFGVGVLNPDQTLDRKKIGRIVFSDAAARGTLERIVHPRVRALFHQRLQEMQDKASLVVLYDVPLLFENKLDRELRPVVVVYASEPVRVERVRQRDGLSDDEIRRRMDSQMSLEEKRAKADYVIDNSGEVEQTRRQVLKVWHDLLREQVH